MLTDDIIQKIIPTDRPIKRSDAHGLFINVLPDGRRLWRLAYRHQRKQKTMTLGPYPEFSLNRARIWCEEMRALLTEGTDPVVHRREQALEAAASEVTFEALAREWLGSRQPSLTPRYLGLIEKRLTNDIFPILGDKPVRSILPRTILDALRIIEARGSFEMAHRVKNHCSEIFRFGIPDGRCLSDPCRDLTAAMIKPPPKKHRAKVEIKALPAFFRKLSADEGGRMSHLALRWTILTMVRTQETRFAQWSEFEGLGSDEPLWRIPCERMKMRSEHLVPLPPQAIDLLREIKHLNVFGSVGNERYGKYLFPVVCSRTDTISENRMLDVMYRMGFRGKATVHGFRSVASTVLNESGLFQADWIEMQLAHAPRGIRGVYNAAKYLPHRRLMMRWWADYLDAAEAAAQVEADAEQEPTVTRAGHLDWFQSSW